MHQVRIALRSNQILRRLTLPARIQRRPPALRRRSSRHPAEPSLPERFRSQHILLHLIQLAFMRKPLLTPAPIHHIDPLARPRIAHLMLVELNPILRRFIPPPARYHIQRKPPPADPIDSRRLLRQRSRSMKRRPHRHHQLQLLRHRRQCRRRRPGIQRIRLNPLNIVQVQLRNQRKVIPNLLRPLAQRRAVLPARLHPLIVKIAKPSPKYRQPESIPHQYPTPAATSAFASIAAFCSASSQSTSLTNGSNPTTFFPSATKLLSAFVS